MSLKENYLEFSKKLGGHYTLIKKGIKRGWIDSIMQGSDIGISKAYEIAKVLGVTMEELLTGKKEEEKPLNLQGKVYGTNYAIILELQSLSKEHQEIIAELIKVLKYAKPEQIISVKTLIKMSYNDCLDVINKTKRDANIKKQQSAG